MQGVRISRDTLVYLLPMYCSVGNPVPSPKLVVRAYGPLPLRIHCAVSCFVSVPCTYSTSRPIPVQPSIMLLCPVGAP